MKEFIQAVFAVLLGMVGAFLMSKDPTAGAIFIATACWLLFKD